jgi:hypothetical protein
MSTQSMMTTTHIPPGADAAFTVGQALTLYSLRARYRATRDLFTPVELARLRFLRWLVCTDRLAPWASTRTRQHAFERTQTMNLEKRPNRTVTPWPLLMEEGFSP